MRPGARFGIAVAIVGEVSVIPFSSKDWNTATLGGKNRGHRSHMFNYEVILIILIKSKHNAKMHYSIQETFYANASALLARK